MSKLKEFVICNREGEPLFFKQAEDFKGALSQVLAESIHGLIGLDLSHKDISDMHFPGISFLFTDLSYSNCSRCEFTDDLSKTKIEGTNFDGAFCRWPRGEKEKKY